MTHRRHQNCSIPLLAATVILSVVLASIAVPSWASEADGSVTDVGSDICLYQQCLTQDRLAAVGAVAAAAVVGASVVAYAYGPEAAIAAAGGFLLFGHLLFDAVPIAVTGVVAWYYGPQAWGWLGFDVPESGK